MKSQRRKIFFVLLLCITLLVSVMPVAAAATEHPGMITIKSGQSVGDGSYINHNFRGYPFIMEFELDESTMPLKSCKLGINSWDCDEDSKGSTREWDQVFVNGTCVGIITGQNNLWKTTILDVPLDVLKLGNNKITIYVGHMDNYTGQTVTNTSHWQLKVNQAFLQFDGGKDANAPDSFKLVLTSASETPTGITCTANAKIQSKQAHSYIIEYSLVDLSINQIVADDEEKVSGTDINSTGHFFLPADASRGSYRIEATLRDDVTGMVYATAHYNFDMEEAISGGCDHQGIGEKKYVTTNYYKLKKEDSKYHAEHQKVDTYSQLCKKCNKQFNSYIFGNEAHTLPICVCGYVKEGYNPIHSATLTPLGICCAGQEFKVEVITHDSVKRITATNDVDVTLNESKWVITDNGDGTRTFSRIYKADLGAKNRVWTIKAYNINNRYVGTLDTNGLTIYDTEKEAMQYPTQTDNDIPWINWFSSTKDFESARFDTSTSASNVISGADEWQYMINFCEKLEDAGINETVIEACYKNLASYDNEIMRELILMMFSSDLIDITCKTTNDDGTRFEGASYQKTVNGRLTITYNGNDVVTKDHARTIFHEIGHAIDSYAAMLEGNSESGLYSVTDENVDAVFKDIENNVRATVTDVVNSSFKDEYFLFFFKTEDNAALRGRYINYLTYKVMNENVPHAQSAEARYGITLTPELQDAYNKVIRKYQQKKLTNTWGDNAYMYVISDVYGGVTNNNIVDGWGHFDTTKDGIDWNYWYEQAEDGQFIQDENGDGVFKDWTICELVAEYIDSSLSGTGYVDDIAEQFFPSLDLPNICEEMHELIADSL